MIHHIAIATRDIDPMRSFYAALPGLHHLRDHHRADGSLRSAWFRCGDSPTILMIEQEAESHGHGCFALLFDGASCGLSRDEIAALPLAHDGSTEWSLYFRDPDGNRLGYSWYCG